MMIMLLVGGVCCCCVLSSAGLGAGYYWNDSIREFIDGLIGTSDKERAQMFMDKGCRSNHVVQHAVNKTWGCNKAPFMIRTNAKAPLKNKRPYVIYESGGAKRYLYDAECVETQDCADLVNNAKTTTS